MSDDRDSATGDSHRDAGLRTVDVTECTSGACGEQAFPEFRFRFTPSGVLLMLIKGYKTILSPWIPPCCRFTPSCSAYAARAILDHGFFKGISLAGWRILRCNPFCQGGYDPVPPNHNHTKDPS